MEWPEINFGLNIAMLVVVIYHLYHTSVTPKLPIAARCLITGESTCLLLAGADIDRLDLCEQCRARLLARTHESKR